MLGLTKRTCHFINDLRKRRSLYLTLVRSNFEHCSVVWRPCYSTDITKFESLQKKAVKWINKDEFSHYGTTPLHLPTQNILLTVDPFHCFFAKSWWAGKKFYISIELNPY